MNISVWCLPKVIRLTMLVKKPDDLIRMWSEVRRKLEPDQKVHWLPVYFRQIEHAGGNHRFAQCFRRVPFERNADHIYKMVAGPQFRAEVFCKNLGSSSDKWHLHGCKNNSHVKIPNRRSDDKKASSIFCRVNRSK